MISTPDVPTLHESVYEPSEDSFLLLDCMEQCLSELQRKPYPVVCEIGSGSGIVSAFLKAHIFPNGFFLATDVNSKACDAIRSTVKANCSHQRFNTLDVLQMSLTLAIRRNSIDVLVFNPPYVPSEAVPQIPTAKDNYTWLDLALLGGENGMEVTWIVLVNLERIISSTGVAYILFCARNNPDHVSQIMEKRGWVVRVVEKRKTGWEILSVLEFKKDFRFIGSSEAGSGD